MKGNIIYKKIISGREPKYADFPEELHPDIQSFLIKQDIKSLYIHQAEAFFQCCKWEECSDHNTDSQW